MAINPYASSATQATQRGMGARPVGPPPGGPPGGGRQQMLQDASEVLGMDTTELKSKLQQGKSVADIAASKGITLDQLKAGLTDKVKARLTADVASGKISQTQSANILSRITGGMENLLKRTAQGEPPEGAPPPPR